MSDQLRHELVKDIKRVAQKIQHPPSASEYTIHAGEGLTEWIAQSTFGSWERALKAAGFQSPRPKRKSREERRFEREVDRYAFIEKLARSFRTELTPHIGTYKHGSKKIRTLMFTSDLHWEFHDEFHEYVWFDTLYRVQPDVVVYGGDITDFYAVSDHNKDPRRLLTMQKEIDRTVNEVFRRTRELLPRADIDWILGNHEWRLWRYLATRSPALMTLTSLSLPELFSLKEYEINLVARPSMINPDGKKGMENFKIYDDTFVGFHGTSTAKWAGGVELERFGRSGCSGHIHRYQVVSKKNLDGFLKWTTVGAGCQDVVGDYEWGLIRIHRGFLIVHLYQGKSVQEYVETSAGYCCVGGKYYYQKEDKE